MTKRKKSLPWREVSLRWRAHKTLSQAKEWLEEQLKDGTISKGVIEKLARDATTPNQHNIPKNDPDRDESLIEYAKEKLAEQRKQSYGKQGRLPPEPGEKRLYKVIARDEAVPCIRLPLHRVKPKKGYVPVAFGKDSIVVGG